MKCGNGCVYALITKKLNCCLAPFAENDPRFRKWIEKDTECMAPKWFLKTDGGKSRNELELYKIVQAQKANHGR